jgi:hypothetical protein
MSFASSQMLLACLSAALASGCMFQQIQETTLKNASGGTVTCKETGGGLISGPVGKNRYNSCIEKAHSDGYQ